MARKKYNDQNIDRHNPDFEGEVNILGMDIRTQALDIKQRVGYIPEQAAIYEVLTPFEYLTFIGRLYGLEQSVIDKKSWDLLRLFSLADKADMRMKWIQ
jgi:ABC-2 type transport system ATP-binding protein